MPALSRWFGLVGGLAVAHWVSAGPGYLPIVGPAPVRFETPRPPVMTPVTLPPLIFIEPRPAPATNEASITVSQATPVPNLSPDEPATPDPAESSVFASPLGPLEPINPTTHSPAVPAEMEVVAPQMLLKYFARRAGTNSSGVSVFAPVGFVPPQPLAPPSSSATFQTTPPAKP